MNEDGEEGDPTSIRQCAAEFLHERSAADRIQGCRAGVDAQTGGTSAETVSASPCGHRVYFYGELRRHRENHKRIYRSSAKMSEWEKVNPFALSHDLEEQIKKNLKAIGFEVK